MAFKEIPPEWGTLEFESAEEMDSFINYMIVVRCRSFGLPDHPALKAYVDAMRLLLADGPQSVN